VRTHVYKTSLEENRAKCTKQTRLLGDYVKDWPRNFSSIVRPMKGVEINHTMLHL